MTDFFKPVRIELTQGKSALVDAEDFERVNKLNWFAKPSKNGKVFYAQNSYRPNGKSRTRLMHRFILNAPKYTHVDHINGDGLDNRKQNIRFCTVGENCRNISTPTHNTSGFKGVSFNKNLKKWVATITYKKQSIYLGSFSDKDHAAVAYNTASVIFFGQFAKLNDVPAKWEVCDE